MLPMILRPAGQSPASIFAIIIAMLSILSGRGNAQEALQSVPIPANHGPSEDYGMYAVSIGFSGGPFLLERPLIGGSLIAEFAGKLNRKIAIGGLVRIDAGRMNFTYMQAWSGRTGLEVIGTIHKRVTLAGAVEIGFSTSPRYSSGNNMSSLVGSVDAILGIDLTTLLNSNRLYLPMSVSGIFYDAVRDGSRISVIASIGLGYRYR